MVGNYRPNTSEIQSLSDHLKHLDNTTATELYPGEIGFNSALLQTTHPAGQRGSYIFLISSVYTCCMYYVRLL